MSCSGVNNGDTVKKNTTMYEEEYEDYGYDEYYLPQRGGGGAKGKSRGQSIYSSKHTRVRQSYKKR
eukprot:scaffold121352_cov53-Attheya_sp.AAC.2